MTKSRILLTLILTGALAACGSDSDSSGDTTGTDTGSEDTGGGEADAGADTGGGTEETGVEETTADPEICDDGEDNDGDGDVDCDDSDCSSDVTCPQPEVCGDGVDNDLDGLTDCDDTEDCETDLSCRETTDTCIEDPSLCTGDQVCNTAGECIDPVSIDTYVPAEDWSYISEIFIADGASDETTCCFDLDGDGEIDNGLGETLAPLLASLAGDLNVLVAEQLEEDTISLLAEYREFPESGTGDGSFHFWFGEGIDGSAGAEGYDTRAAGDGQFQVNDDAFATDIGSYIQLNQLDVVDFVASQEDTIFTITIDASSLLAGLGEISLAIQNAQFEATLDSTDPRFSVDTEVDGINIGGAKLGGYLTLDDLFGQVDDAFSGCTCAAELDGDTPVLTYGDEPGPNYSVACGESAYDVSACTEEADGQICTEFLNTACGFIPAISSIPLADIDTNGNGVPDAISVGLFLTMVSANVDADDWLAIDAE